jgi:hypothetical protein
LSPKEFLSNFGKTVFWQHIMATHYDSTFLPHQRVAKIGSNCITPTDAKKNKKLLILPKKGFQNRQKERIKDEI